MVQLGTEVLNQSGTSTKNESLGKTNQSFTVVHPNKKRLGRRFCREAGGWWRRCGRRRRRWIINMVQSVAIRSVSRRASQASITPIAHPPLIGLFYLCPGNMRSGGGEGRAWFGTCLYPNNRARVVLRPRRPLFQTTQGDSWCAASLLFEGFDLHLPRPVAGVSASSPCRPRLTSPLRLLAISPHKMADSKSLAGRALAGAPWGEACNEELNTRH